MALKIEVKDTTIDTRAGTSQKTGKPYTIREQVAYLHNGEAYPLKMTLQLEDNATAFPVGMYAIDDKSYFVNRFGKLEVGRMKLIPLQGDKPAEKPRAA